MWLRRAGPSTTLDKIVVLCYAVVTAMIARRGAVCQRAADLRQNLLTVTYFFGYILSMEPEAFLTVQEAAQELQVTEGAVRLALSQARLAHTLKYGRKLIARHDLAAYKQRTQPEGVKRVGRPAGSQASRQSKGLAAAEG